ncbi:MAG: arsenosugar biosynthesis radical SAM protein ArsS [Planctomycetes bacterium]|nr:arsenosugar biosynthesis radical SAM protein ArsS [Planctomycetota bacterium]
MDRFRRRLAEAGQPDLRRANPTTLQVNIGLTCNQACHHCHVASSPKRTETLQPEVLARLLELLAASPEVELVDVTGGAPELHAAFEPLVRGARALGRRVMVRSNLTVLMTPEGARFPRFFVDNQVELTCSLPCYLRDNVDRQRGKGVYDDSVRALKLLNGLGYGRGSGLVLNLVYNPGGPSLPPAQEALERDYTRRLREEHGIEFDRLFCLANLPIARFREDLERQGALEGYAQLLDDAFNPDTVPGLMCLSQISVDWTGQLFDCDFHVASRAPCLNADGRPRTVFELERFADLAQDAVRTADYCLGCTAGAGSSCGGALAQATA